MFTQILNIDDSAMVFRNKNSRCLRLDSSRYAGLKINFEKYFESNIWKKCHRELVIGKHRIELREVLMRGDLKKLIIQEALFCNVEYSRLTR